MPKISSKPALWERLRTLCGLPDDASIDMVHKRCPSVGRGTIQRIRDGASTRTTSLHLIAGDLGVHVSSLLSGSVNPLHDVRDGHRAQAKHAEPLSVRIAPPTIAWTELKVSALPVEFRTDAPDDALSPRLPKGTGILFSTAQAPEPGHCVLVADADGVMHIRSYRVLRGDRWEAHATNPAYLSLDSVRDGLRVVAVAYGLIGPVIV